MIGQLCFHPLVLSDREAMQAVTLHAGRRNCNYTFANLLGWQFWYKTEACVLQDAVVLRYIYEGERAYSVCTAGYLTDELVDALLADSGGKLTIYALEDSQAQALSSFKAEVKPMRDLYDYIYRRTDLALLQGGHLQAKRNHVNRFKTDNPNFEYRPLMPELFDECRRLTEIWQGEKGASETIDVERQVMENIFSNWESL
ncbi:MAG: phosphatidylglycerol lysyltransferase domain-containing protein, partial [Bacteroidaceae bacterium]